MELLLLIIAVSASFLVGFLFLYGCIRALSIGGFKRLMKYFREVAYIIDVAFCVLGQFFWNDTMKKKGGYDFGSPHDSISECMGQNKRIANETKWGAWWGRRLNKWDKNHLEKAIDDDC